MRAVVALVSGLLASCLPPVTDPPAPQPPVSYDSPPPYAYGPYGAYPASAPQPELAPQPPLQPTAAELAEAGVSVARTSEFVFDGGHIELELRRDGDLVVELARNDYMVPVVMQWQLDRLANLAPLAPPGGVVVLPASPGPNQPGSPVVLTTLRIVDRAEAYHRELTYHARFGDPNARPADYTYRLPYRKGKTFSVLQGPHGAFSHHGSNEYAVDFDCPVATHVLAARDGVVVAAHASAQGHGTSPDYLELRHTNFVLVRHDDGTLGEYMHLSPSGVEVQPGQRVHRGQEIALSGNTGFSTTPHLHFQVMTAGTDGIAARSFPFQLATAPGQAEDPSQGRAYTSWEP